MTAKWSISLKRPALEQFPENISVEPKKSPLTDETMRRARTAKPTVEDSAQRAMGTVSQPFLKGFVIFCQAFPIGVVIVCQAFPIGFVMGSRAFATSVAKAVHLLLRDSVTTVQMAMVGKPPRGRRLMLQVRWKKVSVCQAW